MFVKSKTIDARHPRLGPSLYASAIQYFVIQILVGKRFSPHYSLTRNAISDLGNSSCGIFNNRQICSPLHTLMNLSFLTLGITMITGSLLLCQSFKKSRNVIIGFTLFAIGGAGTALVGIFPENTVSALHGIGAALPFLIGNVGVVILGFSLKIPKIFRIYTVSTGSISLAALGVYASGHYIGLGEGGLERVVAYPQTIWMIILGLYSLAQQLLDRLRD